MITDKNEVIEKIATIIEPAFHNKGFQRKKSRYFEHKTKEEILFQYEINIKKTKGYFSLHLILNVFDKKLMRKVNHILERALTDPRYSFPENWSANDIESSIQWRIKNKATCSLTDWRILKKEHESLSEFNSRFSIWLKAFQEIEEVTQWAQQLLQSVSISSNWFFNIYDEEWLVENSKFPALVLLKESGRTAELHEKYADLIRKERLKSELELFMEHLVNSEHIKNI